MSRLNLQEFDLRPPPMHVTPVDQSGVSEEQKLEAFENGYKAGWDDASKSHAENTEHVSLELARNLQELSFTFHEARTQVLRDMRVVLEELVSKFLPVVAAKNLSPVIVEQVIEIAENDVGTSIVILINPANQSVLETLLAGQSHLEVRVISEPSLGVGQAKIKFADSESHIDLNQVLAAATNKIDSFFELNTKAG